MLKRTVKMLTNRNFILLLAFGAGLWSTFPAEAADHKIMSRRQKAQEWKRRQARNRELDRKASLMRKEYEMLVRNEEMFKTLMQDIHDGSGETASPQQREAAKKALAHLEKISGPLGAKYDENGALLNADSIEIKFSEKVKQRKIYLLEAESKLIKQQQAPSKTK
ncbi:MAG: hypothetical protein J5858_03055 [Lentisphaeria bacterium]|nr:hypothetical protein [Lentisphaeria bacterium]